MSGTKWTDLPPAGGTRRKWAAILEPLMAQPGQWAEVAGPTLHHYAMRAALQQRSVNVPPGRWEFAARTVEGQGFVYARYIGPEQEQEQEGQ